MLKNSTYLAHLETSDLKDETRVIVQLTNSSHILQQKIVGKNFADSLKFEVKIMEILIKLIIN